MSSGFASTGDIAEKKITFDEIGPRPLRLHGRGRSQFRRHRRRRRRDGHRRAGDAGDGAARDRARAQGHRQADQICGAHRTITPCACSAPRPIKARRSSPPTRTARLIVERGKQDKDSEIGRFPRLFRAVEIDSRPHLADGHLSASRCRSGSASARCGSCISAAATRRATSIAWVPDANVVFSGDLVEYHSACYCGDAHFTDWPETLDRLGGVQGRRAGAGPRRGARGADTGRRRHRADRAISSRRSTAGAATASRKGAPLKEAFDAARRGHGSEVRKLRRSTSIACRSTSSRAYDEAKGIDTSGDLDRRARPRHVGGAAGA